MVECTCARVTTSICTSLQRVPALSAALALDGTFLAPACPALTISERGVEGPPHPGAPPNGSHCRHEDDLVTAIWAGREVGGPTRLGAQGTKRP